MKITAERIIWILAIVAVIYIMSTCRSCHRQDEPSPTVITAEEIHNTIRIAEANYDSAIRPYVAIIKDEQRKLNRTEVAYQDEQDKTLQLQQDNDSLLSMLKANELTGNIKLQAGKLAENDRRKDSLCTARVSALLRQKAAQRSIMDEKDRLMTTYRRQLDSCAKGLTIQADYIRGTKKRNVLSVGVLAGYSPTARSLLYGVTTMLSLKNGYHINVSVIQVRNEQVCQIGVLKDIKL